VLPIAAGLVLFFVALDVLRVELRAVTFHEITRDVLNIPASHLALAVMFTVANYLTLTAYDLMAFATLGKRLSRMRIAAASLLAYSISNSVGFAMLSGAAVRHRFYTRWGLTGEELSRIVFSYGIAFWLGITGLGGLSLLLNPLLSIPELPARGLLIPLGVALLLVPPAYVLAAVLRRRPIRLWRLDLPLPSPAIAVTQVVVSAVDWTLAGSVLYVLLPPSGLTFPVFIGAFLVSTMLGVISHVPGGLGVFESLMVLLLAPYLSSAELLPALVVYRAVYYLLPLVIALVGLLVDEARQRKGTVARFGAAITELTEPFAPRLLAALTFVAGLVLLFSAATPAAPGRLDVLARFLPVGLIEASHFLSSIAGAVLLILSQGLARRLDAAYYFAALTLIGGIAGSLIKGLDYEEASLLTVVLLILYRMRPAFYRRAQFFDTRFSAGWLAATAGAVGASIWLGFFAFKHVNYSHQLWWQFELRGEASRFLRAAVGTAVVLLLFGIARLVRQAPHEAPEPTDVDLADAGRALAAQTSTAPFLVYLADKSLLFNEDRSAFVMYGVRGRTWVSMGDPVGPPDRLSGMIRQFLERADDFGGVPAFYEVGPAHLHRYADFGLTFVKLGEQAKVSLTAFSLDGGQAAKHRNAMRRLEKEGATFRIVAPDAVPALMPELRAVSDDWLASQATAEKGFSLGFFDETYLARFPMALIERDGRIEAFANIWAGPRQLELSVDLMRHRVDAPKGSMDALFVHLLQWGKEQGYAWFALGMAPLSGFEASPVATVWNRLGTFLYEHGESVYNFQGLRAYKDKFNPIWEPQYLAYPGGLRLPRIMADVSALVAGGYRRIFTR
jgi:phosphatidylglycerol lysyltransferase